MGNFFDDLFGKPDESQQQAWQNATTAPEKPTEYEVPQEYLEQLKAITEQMQGYAEQVGGQAGLMNTQAAKINDLAEGYYDQTASVRDPVVSRLASFMAGDLDPYSSIQWQYGKSALEDQYDVARKATMANLPAGGVLQSGLADLETQKAKAALGVLNSITSDEYNKAYGLATSSPQTALSGLSLGSGALSNAGSMLGSAAGITGASSSPINSILGALSSANNFNLAQNSQYYAQQQALANLVAQQQASANQSVSNLGKGLGYLLSGGKGGD